MKPTPLLLTALIGILMLMGTAGSLADPTIRTLVAIPGDGHVTLVWDTPPQASGYNVKRSTSATGPMTVIATNISPASLVVTNLKNGTAYFFAIAAVAGEFASSDTPRLKVTPSAPFLDLLPAGAKVEKLATGFGWAEGPVWDPAAGGQLIFSDVYGDQMLRWRPGFDLTTFRKPSSRANGNTLDLQGRLITCQQTTRSVTRTEADGTLTPLVTQYNGKPFNEPNDVVVKSDGSIWFTDPTYDNSQTQPGQYVYRFDPRDGNASVTLVAKEPGQPNGLAFSPDESRLYVADTDRNQVRVYEVLPDNSLTNGRALISQWSDGMRVDATGRLFLTIDGVKVHGPDGTFLAGLTIPEQTANVCFGGANQEMLFITASSSLYGITRLPDLVVIAMGTSPAAPSAGQSVRFTATVKNQGTGATPAATAIRVAFSVGGETNLVWSDSFTDALPPDASVVLTANEGIAGSAWLAREGIQTIYATVDDRAGVKESLENNNTFKKTQSVAGVPADSDGDGISDLDESAAGTDSGNAQSVLRVHSLELLEPGRIKLTWSSVPGKRYRVTALSSITAPDWIGFSGEVTATESTTSWSGSVPSLGTSVFFRIAVRP